MDIFFLTFFVSLILSYILVFSSSLHLKYTGDNLRKIQNYHYKETPRIGGISILISFYAGLFFLKDKNFVDNVLIYGLISTSFLIFLIGFIEDITKKIKAFYRLIFTFVISFISFFWFDIQLRRLDIFFIDYFLWFTPLSLFITTFSVSGIVHAINLVDGFNGLACGITLGALLSFLFVSFQLQDQMIFLISLSMIGTILGFFVLNYPFGKIFLGDGGAYLIGFLLAIISIVIVSRNELVSPWFPLLCIGYPITETIFTIFRRKIFFEKNATEADNKHFHQMIYRYILFKSKKGKNIIINKINCNPLTSTILIVFNLAYIIPSTLFYNDSLKLQVFFFINLLLYLMFYVTLYSFFKHKLVLGRQNE